MKLGPVWIGSARTHERLRQIVIDEIQRRRESGVVCLGGIHIAQELIPEILDLADGAHVLTRYGRRLRLRRTGDTFTVTDVSEQSGEQREGVR